MIDHAKTDDRRLPFLIRARVVELFIVAFSMAGAPAYSQNQAAETPQPASKSNNSEVPEKRDVLPPTKPESASAGVEYVGPDTYILLDSNGRPQFMPGMTYEDFLAAWKKLNEPEKPEARPRYVIENLDFIGKVVGQRAELDCVATVQLSDDGATDVSLGLVGAILQGQPRFEVVTMADNGKGSSETGASPTPGPERLTYDPEHGGFLARFVGHSGDKRKVTLGLIVPLQHEGAETTLPLNCPRALSSQLTLKTDSEVSEARTNTGAVVSQPAKGGGSAELKIAGPAGIFRLTWQTAAKDATAVASILNALSAIHVTVDGRGIRSDARLTVRSFGGAFDQFRVRLPPGAQLIQARPDAGRPTDAQYRISVESDSADATKSNNGVAQQIVVIELPEKQKGPVVVDLATEQSGGVEKPDQEINLAGFEVVGAVRQFGDVSLTVSDDWQAQWQVGPFVRQVDPSELDATLQSSNPTAAFQYDRQPWSLKLQVAPRRLRLHVSPKFELECQPEEARLVAHLAYQFFGARAFELRVDLKGWEMTGDPVESGGLVDQDRVTVTPQGTLVLPLSRAASRRVEVTLPLRRSIKRDASRLELPLPVPSADSVGTGDLIVRSASNIELLPDLSNSTGLAAPPDSQLLLAGSEDGATELRFRTLLPTPVFVSDRTRRTGEISSQSSAQVELSQDTGEIDQRINYSVRFEPVTELGFEFPADFSPEDQGLEIQLLSANENDDSALDDRNTPLHFTPLNDESSGSGQSVSHQIRATLPRSQIGKFTLRIRYHVPIPKSAAAETEWPIPLIRSTDGESKSQMATVVAQRNLAMSLDDNEEDTSWKADHSNSENQKSTYVFRASGPETSLPLVMRQGRTNLPASTIVDRVWLQTWLANGVEQNRAAFRFRTSAPEATVELSPDLSTAEVETLVDRQPAEIVSQAHGRVVVRLPAPAGALANEAVAPAVHTLELRSRQPYRRGLLQSHRFTPSQIEGSMALSQVYWQIILPGDEHVIQQPAQLTSASQWQWLGSFWGQQPLKSQSDLEDWAGASRQVASSESQSQYLFTGLLPISTIEISTAPRWLVVLIVSSAVLVLVLAFIYASHNFRLLGLALVACVLLAASVSYPEAALLLGQASLLGLLLSGVSLFLRRTGRRPTAPLSTPFVAASSHRLTTPRADSILMPAIISNASTAPTATLRVADSKQ